MFYRISTLLTLFVFSVITNSVAQNIAPTLSATGNQAYCALSQINIVTDFNIVDPDDTGIDALFVQISTGYQSGEDVLLLTGTHSSIRTSWNVLEGKLTLEGVTSGAVSYIDLIAAIKEIVFKSTSTNPLDKSFSITIGDANYLPSTGHYYEYVPSLGITWTAAKAAAEGITYFGLQGYLATITSPEEAQLSGEQAAGAGWIGGSDAETEGVWKWVTGPENGTIFWNGGINGTTPNYANWNTAEPNQAGDEDYAHVTAPNIGRAGSWNDLSNTGLPSGDYQPKGYIVEYGGLPGDPVLNISASTNIFSVETVEALQPSQIPILYECDTDVDGDDTNGFSTFDLTLNEATLLNGKTASDFTFSYFIDATRTIPIVTPPNTFENTFIDNQTIYVRISNNMSSDCYTDVSFEIQVNKLPDIQSAIVFKNCDEDGNPDGFTDFNLNEANDVITNNNTSGLTITYHLSIADANTNMGAVNATLFNNSTANTVHARVENSNGCHRVSTVNLEVSTTAFPSNYLETLTHCDDDDTIDGLRAFDLTQASTLFIAQFPLGQNLSVHYFRNLSDAQLEQNEIISQTNYVNEEEFDQILYVRVESDDNGDCFGLGSHLALKVNPRPEFEIDQTEAYCSDNNPVTLRIINPNGSYNYEWKDENGMVVSNLPEVAVVSIGPYSVIATSNLGCESFPVSYSVVESAKATIDINDITIVELSDNNSITINKDNNNLGIGDYEFALDNEFGSYRDEPFFNQVAAGQHTIYVRDKKKCGTTELDVFILGFPKFFTPNNDGKNDTWQVKGLGADFSNASVVNVYDRYGKFVKQLNAKNGKWDGTFNGNGLPTSDYWFVAQLIDQTGVERIYRGHFSLIN